MASLSLASDIMVMSAHAPASLTTMAKSAVVYMTVMNHGATADSLISVNTAAASSATAHQTLDENGVMKMRALERLEIGANETVVLEPGGIHIMLTGLHAPLKEGDQLILELGFAKGGVVKVSVPVVGKLGLAGTEHEHVEEN
jgi:periplasmic copper chaperone A